MGAKRLSVFANAKRWLGFSDETAESTPGPDADFWYEPIEGRGAISYREALQISAASAAGRAISETLASLPLHIYRRTGGGKELARDHRLFRTLAEQPHERYTAVEMWEQCVQSLLFRGNWLAVPKLSARADVIELDPIEWSKVSVELDRQTQIRTYTWHDDRGERVTRVDSEVLHIPGNAYDGVRGHGLLSTCSGAFGVSQRVHNYVDKYFKNMLPPVAVTFATPMPPKVRDEWFHRLRSNFLGGKAPVVVIDNGGKLEAINLKASELQLVEIMDATTRQMARIFRVPPHLIGDLKQATFSNIEHQGQDFVTNTLMPWAKRIEQRLEATLLGPIERREYSIRFQFDALLRGDAASRAAYYQGLFQVGGITANEIREHEGRNAVEGGDVPMVQGALVPITQAGQLQQEQKKNAA